MATVTSGSPGIGRVRRGDLPYARPEQFGAIGDGVADDTAAFNDAIAALGAGGTLQLSAKTYLITSEVSLAGKSIRGVGMASSGYTVAIPTGGTVIKAEVGEDEAVFSQAAAHTRGWTIEGFSIDMGGCADGSGADDIETSTMTKGLYITKAHNFTVRQISIHRIPTNGAGVAVKGGTDGCYWGLWEHVFVKFKKAAGNDKTAKGFVFDGDNGGGRYITSQEFRQCVSYRGFFTKLCHAFVFTQGGFESSPGNGWLDDNSTRFTFIGGFYEGQGTEDATPANFYQMKGQNGTKQVTFIDVSLSGNGVNGIANLTYFTGDGRQAGDEKLMQLSGISVEEDGTVGLRRSAALAYAVAFNSSVPATTEQALFFATASAGFDRLSEYNSGNGNYTLLLANSSFSNASERVYRVTFNLELTSSTSIPATVVVELRLRGANYTGPDTIKVRGIGGTGMTAQGSLIVRVNGVSSAYFAPAMYHNHSDAIAITHANGGKSGSWFAVERIN